MSNRNIRRGSIGLNAMMVALLALFTALGVGLLGAGCNNVTSDVSGQEQQAEGESSSPKASPEHAGPITAAGDISLRLMKHTLVLVKTKYYDPSRIDWRNMMAHSMDALQSTLVEVVAQFDEPLDDNPQKVTLRVNTKSREFQLDSVKELSDVHEMSKEVMKFVVGALHEEKEAKDLEYTMINGMLDTLDPHSVLLTPEMYEDMMTTHGGFGGLGIVIGIRDEELTVISPIEGTPASRAGLRAQDKIVQIGEESTINMPLHEAVDRLRGEVGTPVDIMVMRKKWSEPRKFTIVRDQIKIRSLITHALPQEKIGYIKIKSFEKNTGADVRKRIAEMKEEMGGMNGLVLDLRFNAGGLLTQAIEVADTFLPKGKVIVVSEGIGGTAREEELSTDEVAETDFPIVVIVNPGSASASEIVAGALKNHDRAVIIGDQTFGKGSVQILRDNDDGSAIKLTIAQYLTPGDISIQGVGIAPDVRVVPVTVDEEGVDMFVSENIRREGNLDLALQSEKTRAPEDPIAVIRYLWEEDEETEQVNSEEYHEDFEIEMARRILTAAKNPERKAMVKQVQNLLGEMEGSQTERIATALTQYEVDWSAGEDGVQPESQPFEVVTQILDTEGSELRTVTGGQEVVLRATVTNKGDQPIYRLFGISHSNNPIWDDRELVFGKIEPGASRSWDLEIKVPRGVETRKDPVTINFGDMNGILEKEAKLAIQVDGLPQPHFAYSYQIIDDEGGNGDGLLQAGESVELVVHVRNVGKGDAGEAMAFLRNESGSSVYLAKGRETIGEIKAGSVGTAQMKFDVKGPKKKSNNLELMLTVLDKDFGARVEELLEIPVYDKPETVKDAGGGGLVTTEAPLEIKAAPKKNAQSVATMDKGNIVELVALNDDETMAKVKWKLGEETFVGWVEDANLTQVDTGEISALEMVASRTPPMIDVDNATLVSQADSIELNGVIKDDESVEDYRVYLWHRDGRKTHAQKLDYGIAGRDEKAFAVQVPLRAGVNRVTIVARDGNKLEHSRTVYVAKE